MTNRQTHAIKNIATPLRYDKQRLLQLLQNIYLKSGMTDPEKKR